jgi:hypothetical protein
VIHYESHLIETDAFCILLPLILWCSSLVPLSRLVGATADWVSIDGCCIFWNQPHAGVPSTIFRMIFSDAVACYEPFFQ